ncbi:hypothetical protein LHJ74_32615 [Streptomyces sp. N2-109]|uniref:Uncharacterized protein n=1 Tax=Streptomyces gossypii TaxID=2883101 RepID=A0ABT2K351_9ACTN|nr:hypothetical protein [Streptomyces gossypii]MCT2594599.1 hypothetical protein [Streptomyces gossypii]
MSFPDRKQEEVRKMLDTATVPIPPDLGTRAAFRGGRLRRRRHALRTVLWTLAFLAAVAFAAWAVAVEPWIAPPATTPPLEGW